jgi:hypothetical protein
MKKDLTLREALSRIQPRQFVRLETVSPFGSLELRKAGKGALSFYWRVTHEGHTDRYQIGLYDPSAPPKSTSPTSKGYSLVAARKKAADMAAEHYEAKLKGGYRSIVAADRARLKEEHEAEAASAYTFDKLFELYVEYLGTRNRETARQASTLFARNVRERFPQIASCPASKVTAGQVADVLRPLSEAGKDTTARKLKAYLSSAFEKARNPEHNPSVSSQLAKFKIRRNPVSDVSAIAQRSGGVDKNPLMPEEMRHYWKLIDIPGQKAALLRLHLMLGGQRIEQFIRMRNKNVHPDMITLVDTKGRTGNERLIHLPRTTVIDLALKEFTPSGEFALSVTPEVHISPTTVRSWARSIVGGEIEGFTLKRVRSGVATLLAKLGVGLEIRNSLQSHGLHGVENRHYNKYDFYDEKKVALEKMYQYLTCR